MRARPRAYRYRIEGAYLMPEPEIKDLRTAVKLFNRWQFQEACDTFKVLAEEAHGRDRAYLEGIVQVSNAFHRVWHKGGEANAMVSYLQRSIDLLRPFDGAGGAMGIELEGSVQQLEMCLEEAMRWRRGDSDIFNRDLIPRIVFVGEPLVD